MKKGFTLVELLLYIGLCTLFLGIVTQIFSAAVDVQTESESFVPVELDGRYILSRLAYDIHRATAVNEPNESGSPSPSLTLLIAGNTYRYMISGGNLLLSSSQGDNSVNSVDTTASEFSVTRLSQGVDTPSLRISLTLTAKTVPVAGPLSKHYETTIALR